MNPLINHLKGEQLMNQLTVIEQETNRNQRLSFTAKTLEKNFDRIKEIRDSFKEQGIVLKYTPQGTRWRIENGKERGYKKWLK